jgi:hypothetical protein
VTKNAGISTGNSVVSNNCPTVVVNDGNARYYCLYGRDYTASLTATSGGNKYLKITFVNNFEANHPGLTTLDPSVMAVRYRVKPDTTNSTHAKALKYILEKSGVSVDSASFTAADSALSTNVNFSIPTFSELDYQSYYHYVEKILSSTLGYLTIDSDLEIAYGLFDTPSSTDEITSTDVIDGTAAVKVEYKDIIDHIIAYNDHVVDSEVSSNSSISATSNKARYLHGINKTVRFVHALEDISNRLDDIISFRSNRFAYYTFRTKTKNLDTIIGDEFLLKRDGLLGNVESKSVVTIGVHKQTDDVSVEVTDLYNV